MAIVNSTTPRFGPRWPPVLETRSIKNSLTSLAQSGIWAAGIFFRSVGELMDGKIPINLHLPHLLSCLFNPRTILVDRTFP